MIINDGHYPANINSLDTGIEDEDICLSCEKKVEYCECPFDCPECKEGNLRQVFIWENGKKQVGTEDRECDMCGHIVTE